MQDKIHLSLSCWKFWVFFIYLFLPWYWKNHIYTLVLIRFTSEFHQNVLKIYFYLSCVLFILHIFMKGANKSGGDCNLRNNYKLVQIKLQMSTNRIKYRTGWVGSDCHQCVEVGPKEKSKHVNFLQSPHSPLNLSFLRSLQNPIG